MPKPELNIDPLETENLVLSDEQKQAIEEFKSEPWGEEGKEETLPAKPDSQEEKPKEEEEIPPAKEEKDGEEETKTPEEIEAEVIRKIAEEERMSEDEAKEALTKDKSVAERHGNDAIKIARALRKENQAYSLAQNKIKELEKFKSDIEKRQLEASEEQFERGVEAQRDKIIETYIEKHPDQADLSEDVIFERAKVKIKEALSKQKEIHAQELAKQASVKREELAKSIPDGFEDVAPEVKQVLKEMDDAAIMEQEGIDHVLYWARGKKYSPEYIKKLEEAAYKRGKEEPTIKSKQTVSSDSRAGGGKKTVVASDADRKRAREMFGNREGWTEEKMLDEYLNNHKGKDFWD